MSINLRKGVKRRIAFFILIGFILTISSPVSAFAKEKKEVVKKIVDNVQYNKEWTITMNAEIDKSTVKGNVFVEDAYGNRVNSKVELGNKKNELIVKPPKGGYSFSDTYNLIILGDVKDVNGIRLNDDIKTVFTIENKPEIAMCKLDKDPIIEGESIGVILNSNTKSEVQYKIEAVDNKTGEKIQLINYSEKVKGNDVIVLRYNKGLKEGSYKLKTYMRRADIDSSDYIHSGYDYIEEIELEVIDSKTALDISGDIKLGNSEMFKRSEQYEISIGKSIYIKGIKTLEDGEYLYKINAYNTTFKEEYIKQFNYNDSIKWEPPTAGKYVIDIFIKKKKSSKNYDAIKTIIVNVDNKVLRYVEYDMTLDEFAKSQFERNSAVYYSDGQWRKASKEMIEYYLNPENFVYNEEGLYQFLTLNYVEGMSKSDVNKILENKGILDGKGQAILDGAKKYNVNPAYLIAHTILETGHGSSELAKGIKVTTVDGKKVEPKIVYNMYGIQAIDKDARKYGSEFAYKQGWFTPEKALTEGAKWVGSNYINNEEFQQNTLYKMRWNKDYIWHQYATDVKWASNQIYNIKKYLDLSPKAILEFEIPIYIDSNISKQDIGSSEKSKEDQSSNNKDQVDKEKDNGEEIILDETTKDTSKNDKDKNKDDDVIDFE